MRFQVVFMPLMNVEGGVSAAEECKCLDLVLGDVRAGQYDSIYCD